MANRTVAVFRALSDESRLSILQAVIKYPAKKVSGCDIVNSCTEMTRMSQPAVSHHFAKLVSAEVLLEQKVGTKKYYELNHKLLKEIGINSKKLSN